MNGGDEMKVCEGAKVMRGCRGDEGSREVGVEEAAVGWVDRRFMIIMLKEGLNI